MQQAHAKPQQGNSLILPDPTQGAPVLCWSAYTHEGLTVSQGGSCHFWTALHVRRHFFCPAEICLS